MNNESQETIKKKIPSDILESCNNLSKIAEEIHERFEILQKEMNEKEILLEQRKRELERERNFRIKSEALLSELKKFDQLEHQEENSWIEAGFDSNQMQAWLASGLLTSEALFAKWLVDIKSQENNLYANPEQLRDNLGNNGIETLDELREEFQNFELLC